jgi:hypothetical protein
VWPLGSCQNLRITTQESRVFREMHDGLTYRRTKHFATKN